MRRARCTSSRSSRSTRLSAAAASISSVRPTRTPQLLKAPANLASWATTPCAPLTASLLFQRVSQQPGHGLFPGRLDVVLVLEQAAERRAHGFGVERAAVQAHQRLRPVERLGDAGQLAQLPGAQPLHEARDRLGELLVHSGHLAAQDAKLFLEAGMLDIQIQAAPPQRVADLARAVRSEHDPGHVLGAYRPELRNRDLEIREHFEEKGLEALVGAIDLVDQQDRGALAARDRAQQRPLEQVLAPEDQIFELGGIAGFPLRDAQAQQLALVVPLVESGVGVQALVAWQPDEFRGEQPREHLRDLGLADPRLAF